MKKYITVMLALMLVSGLGAAVANYDGPKDQPHIMGGDSGSSAEASTGVGPNGTSWTSKIENVGSTCLSGDGGEKISNITYSGQDAVDGLKKVEFVGKIEAGTPCHQVTHEVEEVGEDSYVLNVSSERSDEVCVDCVGELTYKGSFEAPGGYSLVIKHNGDTVEEFDFSSDNKKEERKEKTEKGFLGNFWKWITALF